MHSFATGATPGKARRLSVAALAGATAAVGAGALICARHRSPYRPVLERIEVSVPILVTGGQPIRIGFIADTHVGPVIRPAHLERALALLFAEHPDLLLLGGDYVCESPRFITETAQVLGCYGRSARLGACAVLGNHDLSMDAERMTQSLEKQGIKVLRNEAARVEVGQTELWIAGIDDAILGCPDPALAFAGVPPGAATIALWHEPDWAESVAPFRPLLQLSGHSHGGQISLPVVGNLATPPGGRRFVAGMNVAAGMPIYTSRGVGVYRPPVRIGCPPEVTLVRLTASREDDELRQVAGGVILAGEKSLA